METKLAKKRGPKPSGVKTEVLFKRVPAEDKEVLSALVDAAMDRSLVEWAARNKKHLKDGNWFFGMEGGSAPVPSNPSHSDDKGVSTPTPSLMVPSVVADSGVEGLKRMNVNLSLDNEKLKREIATMLAQRPPLLQIPSASHDSFELVAAKKRIAVLEKIVKEYDEMYA